MRDESLLTRPRPIRTLCMVRGDREADFEQAVASAADAIVLDLEHPRYPIEEEDRVDIRRRVGRMIDASPAGKMIFVRVQAIQTGQILKDLDAVVRPNLDGVLVPQIYGPEEVHASAAMLLCLEVERGLTTGSTLVYPILETAQAVHRAYEIAVASPRVKYMGGAVSRIGDIVESIGYRWTQGGKETLYIRQKVLLDCKAAGIKYPISGNWAGRLDDLDGLKSWAEELRDIGYAGMMVNNLAYSALDLNRLVTLVNEVFTPTAAEIAYWQDLLNEEEAARARGDDRIFYHTHGSDEELMIHESHLNVARRGLELARDLRLIPD